MSTGPFPTEVRTAPFMELIGATRELNEGGEAVVSVELRHELKNTQGIAHGGVLLTLLDSAFGHAAMSRVDFARDVVTVNMSVSFLRPARGPELIARARATGGGQLICFCEGEVVDAAGEVLVSGLGTFRYKG